MKNQHQEIIEDWTYTHYVRDASGNVMSIYKETFAPCVSGGCSGATNVSSVKVADQPIYGSDRVGSLRDDREQLSNVAISGGDTDYLSSHYFGGYGDSSWKVTWP
ncbi:MAG: hypothetical protein U5L96_17185 [Owenweeksia sp.]|nr:hypothetical protein [Owenweeksia sp.]